MLVKSLTIQGFKSFLNNQKITFDSKPGLYLLKGDNKLEPELGANGAGKSTVWDAIVWTLYGKTSRGLRAKNIVSWFQDGEQTRCEVELGSGEVICRTQNPNTLTLREKGSARVVGQDDVDRLVGVDYKGFLATTLMSQFGNYFFDVTPSDKLALFSSLLDIDRWDSYAQTAKEKRNREQKKVAELELKKANLDGKLTSQRSELLRKKENLKTLLKELAVIKKRSENTIKEHEKSIRALNAKQDEAIKEQEEEERNKKKAEDQIRVIAQDKVELISLMRTTDRRVHGIEIDEDLLKERLSNLAKTKSMCVTCGRPMSEKEVRRSIKDTESKLIGVREKMKEALKDSAALQKRMAAEDKKQTNENNKFLRAKQKIDRLREVVLTCQQGINKHLNDIKTVRSLANVEKGTRVDDAGKEIREAKKKIQELKEDYKKTKKKQEKALLLSSRFAFWIPEFRKVKLWIVQKALEELTIFTNNALDSLGLVGWRVEFDVQREKVSGGVTKGFTVFIFPPESNDAVAWEAWSGGETQRLRIAGELALADLVGSISGYKSNIEIWDEPTQHLNEGGIDDLLQFLRERALRQKKQIWVVDHKALEFGHFDGEKTVVKDFSGSKVI